jgi:hypothetical protein
VQRREFCGRVLHFDSDSTRVHAHQTEAHSRVFIGRDRLHSTRYQITASGGPGLPGATSCRPSGRDCPLRMCPAICTAPHCVRHKMAKSTELNPLRTIIHQQSAHLHRGTKVELESHNRNCVVRGVECRGHASVERGQLRPRSITLWALATTVQV